MSDLTKGDLKPCPLCGAESSVACTFTDTLDDLYWYCFCINDCVESRMYDTESQAVAAWNRRAKDE